MIVTSLYTSRDVGVFDSFSTSADRCRPKKCGTKCKNSIDCSQKEPSCPYCGSEGYCTTGACGDPCKDAFGCKSPCAYCGPSKFCTNGTSIDHSDGAVTPVSHECELDILLLDLRPSRNVWGSLLEQP